MSLAKKFRDRLEKLATHLETGKLGHKKFAFDKLHHTFEEYDQKPVDGFCGSVGCAMGELPIVFPRQFKYEANADDESVVARRGEYISELDFEKAVMSFFKITKSELEGLFYPADWFCHEHVHAPWNKTPITARATKKQVARGIRRFINWRETNGPKMV